MHNIDLNFLKEDEIEAIVSVIEKDFEVKALENSRICRIRKMLINRDHTALMLSHSPFEGSFCVLCCSRFFMILNPKRTCSSCEIQICNSCCIFVKKFEYVICKICQQQQDLMAMNCSWFYETMRRRFMEGGSQIVANSLSEYPKKNAISPYILNMVKGAQITKFRHQIEDASSSIVDSLRKVEGIIGDDSLKSERYTELIKMYTEKLKLILHNTFQVLHITLENYNNKVGSGNQNVDIQVLRILHDEVELLVGKKINLKKYQDKIRSSRKGNVGAELRENLEMKLATAIVEKLISDHQQFLIEGRNIQYDDLNIVLKKIVKNESIDFDFDSISQVPSRHGTVRQSQHFHNVPNLVKEVSPVESDDSSKFYSLSGIGERTNIVSKQWNEMKKSDYKDDKKVKHFVNNEENPPKIPNRSKRSGSITRKKSYENEMKIDSDVVTMAVNNADNTNWLMNARHPFGSLSSLNIESNDPYSYWNKSKSEKSLERQKNPAPVKDNDYDIRGSLKINNQYSSLNNLSFRSNEPYRNGDEAQPCNKENNSYKNETIDDHDGLSRVSFRRTHHYGSLKNIHTQKNNSNDNRNKDNLMKNANLRQSFESNLDKDLHNMYRQNKVYAKDSMNSDIDYEYKRNLAIAFSNSKQSFKDVERMSSKDSGVALSQNSTQNYDNRIYKTKSAELLVKKNTVPRPPPLKNPISKSKIRNPIIPRDKKESDSSIDSDPHNIIAATRADIRFSPKGKFK